jgi:O-succinylbenzoate synthase
VKIAVHRYTLRPGPDPATASPATRHGVLLRLDGEGFSDLHPWPEFGQEPLAEQLASLAAGRPAPLAAQALSHARTDAAARRAGISLFAGLPTVRSHALFTGWTGAPRTAFEDAAARGFGRIKLKIGRDPVREAEALNALADLPVRWRLDANARFPDAAAINDGFLARLTPAVHGRLDFLEDPCPYDPQEWTLLTERTGLPLALDWQLPSPPPPWPGVRLLVLKPASQNVVPLAAAAVAAGLNLVVTHSMDHPLGRAIALQTAMQLRRDHGDRVLDGGLSGGGLHAPDVFQGLWSDLDPAPGIPPGTGFGFDEVLAGLAWEPL